MTFRIVITASGLSVEKQQQLFDEDHKPVSSGPSHMRAVGFGDFADDPINPTEAEISKFRKAFEDLVGSRLGRTLAALLADVKIGLDQIEALKAELASMKAERDAAISERNQLRNGRRPRI